VSHLAEVETIDRRQVAEVPTFLLIVAGFVTLIGCSMTIAGAVTSGIFGNDPIHVERLTEFLDSGRYALVDELDAVAPGATPDNAYVYGPVTTGLAHEINVLAGIERPGQVERTPDAYLVRHLVVAGLGLVGMAAAAVLGAIALGSWRWGVVVAGVLAALPLWTGNAMFNVKDTPVAAGQSLATLGLVLIAGSSERVRPRRLIVGATALAVGVVVMVGTRPGMWVSLAVSLAVFLVVVAWSGSPHWQPLAAAGGAVVASYLALFAIYPVVFAHPLRMLWTSATASADFSYGRLGEYKASGRFYQLDQMAHVWPLVLLAFLAVGLVSALGHSLRGARARSTDAAVWTLVGAQAIALPILIVAHNSNLANGLRQTLFVVPAQAVLVAAGFAAAIGVSRSRRAWHVAGTTIAAAGLILPTAAQLAMFPYQYSQQNVLGEFWATGDSGSEYAGDLDYFKTSFREFVPEVSAGVKLVCPAWLARGEVPERDDDDCRTRRGGTFSTYWRFDGKSSSDRPVSDEFYALLRGSLGVPRNCVTVHEVTRWQNVRRVTLSRLLECHDGSAKRGESIA
jgi:hypothetical protein